MGLFFFGFLEVFATFGGKPQENQKIHVLHYINDSIALIYFMYLFHVFQFIIFV